YNGYQVWPADEVIIVEGYPSVWWLWQNGLQKVVGLMGADCSDEQARIISECIGPNGRVWIMTDGDDAGERCATSVLAKIAAQRFTRWVKLDSGKQPTDYTREQLQTLLRLQAGSERG